MFKHYSSNWITQLEDREYEQEIDDKPQGLWFDASLPGEYSWKQFATEHGIRNVDAAHEIKLFDDSNLLLLSSESDLSNFTEKYGVRYENRYGKLVVRRHDIDWRIVKNQYQGIIIAPHQELAKEKFSW